MIDKIEVILEVLLTLEYMKLCVDHENPVGDGVPVDIVVMPDCMIDMDGAAIAALNDERDKHEFDMLDAAEVGSRAGRVLSVLANLRDLDDEGFQLHYIAKTGSTGRAVLENRLDKHLRKLKMQPLNFPLLSSSERTNTRFWEEGPSKRS